MPPTAHHGPVSRALAVIATAVVLLLTGCDPGGVDQSQQVVPTPPSVPARRLPTANYSTDLAKVCSGIGFANVAPYRPGSIPKVVAFVKTPEQGATYAQQAIFQGRKTSFQPPAEFSDISVVACVTAVPGSTGAAKQCPEDHPVFSMVSYRATVDLFAAATGEKLGSAGTIDASRPLPDCRRRLRPHHQGVVPRADRRLDDRCRGDNPGQGRLGLRTGSSRTLFKSDIATVRMPLFSSGLLRGRRRRCSRRATMSAAPA